MTTLTITDLVASTELDSKAMASVYGGELPVGFPGALFSSVNNVLDLDLAQAFAIESGAANSSLINAAQGNHNVNGTQQADQYFNVTGRADSTVYDIGNLSIGR